MKEETRFYRNRVYPQLNKLKNIGFSRLENSVSSGDPDLSITYKGKTTFIELKVSRGPRGAMSFRPLQCNWHRREKKAGGNILVLTYNQLDKKMYAFDLVENSHVLSPKSNRCYLDQINNKFEVTDIHTLII